MILSYKACPFCNAIGVGDLGLCFDLKGSVRYGPFRLDDFLELLALEDLDGGILAEDGLLSRLTKVAEFGLVPFKVTDVDVGLCNKFRIFD